MGKEETSWVMGYDTTPSASAKHTTVGAAPHSSHRLALTMFAVEQGA